MKVSMLYAFVFAVFMVSCNTISNKPVFEKLNTNELSKSIKIDTSFASFYKRIRNIVDEMDDIKKAKFNDVTYRRLFKHFKFLEDTSFWRPKHEQWDKDWDKMYSKHLFSADSLLSYWKRIKDENSLSKYIKIELINIRKEYYDYIGGIKEVDLGFRMTPLKGPVQQFRFNYGFNAKIHGEKAYFEKHRCIETEPLLSSRIGYWEVKYSEKDMFAGKNVETFLRDYDFHIEVTEIRKEGVNISVEDFVVPEQVAKYLEVEDSYPVLVELYKDEVIKALIDKNYLGRWEYSKQRSAEAEAKNDQVCFDFLKEIGK